MKENRYSSLSLGRFIAESNGISKKSQNILEASRRASIRKKNTGHVQRFTKYCYQMNVDALQAATKIGIEYLTEYFYTGVGYSSVNTARCGLFFFSLYQNWEWNTIWGTALSM